MNKYIKAIACVLFALATSLSVGFEFPACNQEQLINHLQALPLEDQLHIIHQAIQALPPELQPVQNLPVNEQPHVQQQQLQEILHIIQEAIEREQNNPNNPMDEMD